MIKIPKDFSKMTEPQKDACIRALVRILNPAKGLHLGTLVAMTGEMFDIEGEAE